MPCGPTCSAPAGTAVLLRLGWAAINADPLPATPRRPLPDIADWLNDGAFIVGADAVSKAG